MIHTIGAKGLCGMEVVEVPPPWDVNDSASRLACRVRLDSAFRLETRSVPYRGQAPGTPPPS
jgi:hypothetical protein